MPHACGEKLCCERRFPFDRGSTPRMWGKELYVCSNECLSRFNPTHVGKSSVSRLWSVIRSVQPHACGEKGMVAIEAPIV